MDMRLALESRLHWALVVDCTEEEVFVSVEIRGVEKPIGFWRTVEDAKHHLASFGLFPDFVPGERTVKMIS